MSDVVFFKEIHVVNDATGIANAPDWLRPWISPTFDGFIYNGQIYNYGNYLCLLSNGNTLLQSKDQIQAIAQSYNAFIDAGLVNASSYGEGITARFMGAYTEEGEILTYVQPTSMPDGDEGEINVLTRSPVRDELTGKVDQTRTWLIIGREYASGRSVDAVRMSHFTERMRKASLEYTEGQRGID